MLFKSAKALFDMRHENDRLHLVQAALLLTWHLENADTVSMNNYYWCGVACRIGYGIGFHRDIRAEPSDRMPGSDPRLYRRTWWTLFQLEAMAALEHGRPLIIRIDDFDQVPLEVSDFHEANGTVNSNIVFEYSVKNIELCYLVLEILQLTSPGARIRGTQINVDALHSRLTTWALNLPTSNQYFWSLQLHVHYHCVVLHLFRLFPEAAERSTNAVNAVELCNGATRSIINIFELMIKVAVLDQSSSTSIMALTAAAVHLSKQIQTTVGNGAVLVALNTIHDLQRIFPCPTIGGILAKC
jgi:transcriptional regulatory protein AMDR